jgi:hypothetical protein
VQKEKLHKALIKANAVREYWFNIYQVQLWYRTTTTKSYNTKPHNELNGTLHYHKQKHKRLIKKAARRSMKIDRRIEEIRDELAA